MSKLAPFLQRAGWKPKAGAWAAKSGRKYRVVEDAAPGAWDRSVAAFLAKAILLARAQPGPAAESIAALKVKRASPLTDSRLAKFVAEVAPEQGWILFDEEGRVFPHVASAPELAAAASQQVVAPSRQVVVARQQSLFTDLNQWMLKVLLASRLQERLLAARRDRVPRNASTLAEIAKVSIPAAARFLKALDADGQLDTRFGDLRIARPLELLLQWRDRTGHPARRELALASVRGSFKLEKLAMLEGAYARSNEVQRRPLVLGLHAACAAMHLGHVSGTVPVVWSPDLEPHRLEELGLVAVEGDDRADVVLKVPRYPESLFRGVVRPRGMPVTDIVQCWLDVSHSRIRGEEQADFLWRKVLKPSFTP